MAAKNKKGIAVGWIVAIIAIVSGYFSMIVWYFLQGTNIALFNPQGKIAQEQHDLMIFIVAVMFAVAIPSLFLFFFTAWRYRESNTKANYAPNTRHGKVLVATMWLVPISIVIILATVMVPATHRLAPQKSIASDAKPIKIQVISLRWKWLFLYPEQGIATVNFVQVPLNTPIEFDLTADEAPMSSFWIPNLGGQLYTMTGMVNRLHLMADVQGDYPGSSAEINGIGFAGMKFTARASTDIDFERWIKTVKQSPDQLNTEDYQYLVQPSENNPLAFFSSFDENIFSSAVAKYTGPSEEGGTHHQ